MSPPLLAGDIALSAALDACSTSGHPNGRAPNAEVATLVAHAGVGRQLQCHRLTARFFPIRHDLQLKVPADFYLVEHSLPIVFWLQPRKGFTLDDTQRRLLASVVNMTFAAEWDGFDFEVLDTNPAPGSKERAPRTFRLADMPLVAEAEVAEIMQRFADAFDIVKSMDLGKGDEAAGEAGEGRDDSPDRPGPLFDQLRR
jgi:hypothetical protein